MAKVIRLSKPFYLALLAGVPFLIILTDWAFVQPLGTEAGPKARYLIFATLETLVLLGSLIFFFVFWYRAWKAVHSRESRFSPGERLLILLFPFVNVFWAFKAFGSWGKRYNEYLRQENLPLPRVKEYVFSLFSSYFAILMVYVYVVAFICFFSVIPMWKPPLSFTLSADIFHVAVVGSTTYYVCDAVNRLP